MSLDHSYGQGQLMELRRFLHALCSVEGNDGFVFRLVQETSRWSSVEDLLGEAAKDKLHELAFRPSISGDGFSACNLKAHYVLDEDFIDNGSAIILFSLVGALWTHVEHVSDQNEFTTAEMWLEEGNP